MSIYSLRKFCGLLQGENEVSRCTKVDPGVCIYWGKFKNYFLRGLEYLICKIEPIIEVSPAMVVERYEKQEATSTTVFSLNGRNCRF